MTRTRWIIFAIVTTLIIGGLFFLPKPNRVDVSNTDPAKVEQNTATADNVYGNKDAEVVLIEYGDFQCPGCGAAFPIVKGLKEKYKDDIAFVFRHLPLTSIHPNALAAATVAEAAGKQSKFWEMHDKLYENQQAWANLSAEQRTTTFEGYAKDIGLNVDQYNNDLSSEEISRKINRDRALAGKVNATSTPTFVLNGKNLEANAWQNKEEFEKLITDEIKKAEEN